MTNNTHLIKGKKLTRLESAANAISKAMQQGDADCRAADRRADLHPHEREQLKSDARAKVAATVATQRAAMTADVAEWKGWGTTYSPDAPSGEESQQRTYYSQRAQVELAGLSAAEALARCQAVAETGDRARTEEYLAVAEGRGVAAAAVRGIARQVEPEDARMARSWVAAMGEVERQLGWLDQHIESLMTGLGKGTADPKRDPMTGAPLPWPGDRAPEAPIDTRVLDLWRDGLSGHAGKAFSANEAHEAEWAAVAAELPNAGTTGWDATGTTESAEAPAADAQAPTVDAGAGQ